MEIKHILLVEDDPHDAELTLEAFRDFRFANRVDVVTDGEEALDYLFLKNQHAGRSRETPAVVLLDIKLRKVSGVEVLRQIRATPELHTLPVVMLTSSAEEQDLTACYELGANAYVVKPMDFAEFIEALKQVGLFWVAVNRPPPSPYAS